MLRVFWLSVVGGLLSITMVSAAVITVPYGYVGNHRGKLYIPPSPRGQMGVIIYNYDEYYDRYGETISKDRGYDLAEIARLFGQRGYLFFVPQHRYRKVNAIQGAILAMSKHPLVDKTRIHVFGVSEGATLSLLGAAGVPQVRSIIMAAPTAVHEKGIGSIANLVREIDGLTMPVFIGVGSMDKKWRTDYGTEIKDVLVRRGKKVVFKTYPAPKHWFWLPRSEFMDTVFQFLKQVESDALDYKRFNEPKKEKSSLLEYS